MSGNVLGSTNKVESKAGLNLMPMWFIFHMISHDKHLKSRKCCLSLVFLNGTMIVEQIKKMGGVRNC